MQAARRGSGKKKGVAKAEEDGSGHGGGGVCTAGGKCSGHGEAKIVAQLERTLVIHVQDDLSLRDDLSDCALEMIVVCKNRR